MDGTNGLTAGSQDAEDQVRQALCTEAGSGVHFSTLVQDLRGAVREAVRSTGRGTCQTLGPNLALGEGCRHARKEN